MNTRSLIVLALLMGVAAAAPAKGARFKGGGSHGGSHSHAQAEGGSGGGVHLPSLRARSGGNGASAPAEAASTPGAAGPQTATMDRLNAELAAQRAATPAAPPLGLPALSKASAPDAAAGNDWRVAKRAPVDQPAALAPMKPADLTALVPRDSARSAANAAERREDYRYNARGVNCSLYPARCG